MVRVNKHSLYTSIREKPAASAAPCFEDACLKLCSVWCAKAKSAGESVGWMLSAVTHKHGIRTAMPHLSRPVASTCIAASYSPRLLHHRSLTSASNGRERESNQWAEFMDERIGPNLGPKMSCSVVVDPGASRCTAGREACRGGRGVARIETAGPGSRNCVSPTRAAAQF